MGKMKKYAILPPSQKWVVLERYLRGAAPKELCQQPGVSRSQIKRWLKAARTRADEIFRPTRYDESELSLKNIKSLAKHTEAAGDDLEKGVPDEEPNPDDRAEALIETLRAKIAALRDRNSMLLDSAGGYSAKMIDDLEMRIKQLTTDNQSLRTKLAKLWDKGKNRRDR